MCKRVIIADGNRLFRETVGKLLSSAQGSFEVVAEAENSQKVMEEVDRRHPDVIIVDLHLSGANGFRLIERLRDRNPDLKIIAIALEHYEGYRNKALALGADDYCSKFDHPQQLLNAVFHVLAERAKHHYEAPQVSDLAVAL